MPSQPLIKPSAWLTGESLDLMNFIAEKSKTAVEPVRLTKLCEEFIEKYGSLSLRCTLQSRLRMTLRQKIPKVEGLDTVTKAKMMFVLSGTVDSVFLTELQEAGVVILDERCRITRFLTHDGRMVCSGKHMDPGTEREAGKDDEILDFLCKISERDPQPMTLVALAKRYKMETNCPLSESTLAARLSDVRKTIYTNMTFAKNIRIRMMFVSGVALTGRILEDLRKYATIEVDEYKRITAYKAHNNSLQLKDMRRSGPRSPSPAPSDSSQTGSRSTRSARSKTRTPEPEKLDEWIDRMMEFLAERSKKTSVPMIFPELDKAFRRASGYPKSTQSAHKLLDTVKKQIFTTTKYDLKTRVKMMYISMTPVTGSVLEELRKNAIVEVTDRDIIKFYKAYDGSLELPVPPPIVPAPPPEVYAVTSSGRRVRQLAATLQVDSPPSTPSRPAKRSSSAHGQTVSKKPRRGRSENIPVDDTADEPESRTPGFSPPYSSSPSEFHQEEDIPSNSTDLAGRYADFLDFSPFPDTNTQSTSSAFYFPETLPESFLVNVKTEVPDDDDVICDTTFVPVNNTTDLSFTPSNSTQNMTDSRTYLVKLRGLILSIETPLFDDLKRDFNKKYQLFKYKTHRVPIYNILSMLNSTYMTAMQYSRAPKPEDPKDQFMSLKEFLNSLYIHVVTVEDDELGTKIAEAKQNAGDLVVPIDRIRDSLATLIYVSTSKLL